MDVLPVENRLSVYTMVRALCDHDHLPIRGVQSNGMNFDKDIIVPHLGQRDVLHLSLAYTDDFDRFRGSG
jgi:hypothetical protein